jgi:shikimate kinase
MPDKNIVLTGFMGAGKSTVGRRLAKRLGLEFVDTDELIEALAGKSVKDIFKADGEGRFREYERDVLKTLAESAGSGRAGMVVSTGGGIIKDPVNRTNLKRIGLVVWLKVSLDDAVKRTTRGGRMDEERPLLANGGKEAAGKLLLEREPFYAEADVIVDTTSADINSVVAEIEEYRKKHC